MSFDLPYHFKQSGKEVVIQHKGGGDFNKFLRVKPNGDDFADPNGGKGKFARWEVELIDGGSKCKIKSVHSGKYLRIEPGADHGKEDKVDVKGTGGKWTVFKVHQQGQPGHVKLESNEQSGKYLAVQKDNVIRIGNGGPWTELRFFREGDTEFTKQYMFAQTNTVVIQHKGGGNGDNHTKFWRVNPNNLDAADPDGGKGQFAQWEADPQDGGSKVRFKSLKTGKYLRIMNDKIDVGGIGGKWTVFKVHKQGNGIVKLESNELGGKYLAVQGKNNIAIGNGGKWTEFKIFRK
jgi:hypothetical protein